MRIGSPRRLLLAMLLSMTIGVAPPPAAADDATDWSPMVWPILTAYRDGDYDAVQQLAVRVRASDANEAAQRDARALAAMALLCRPARDDRLAGRTLLSNLAAEYPELLDRAECQLAYGIGLTGLYETAEALDHLYAAIERFDPTEQRERLADALIAAARAWAVHGEWERPIPRLELGPIVQPAERFAIRMARLDQIEARLGKIGARDDALRQARLIRAEMLLAQSEDVAPTGRADAIAALEGLAANQPLTRASAAAAIKLAAEYQREHRADEAAALLSRVAEARFDDLAGPARESLDALWAPRLAVRFPPEVRPDSPFLVSLDAQNVREPTLEFRELDLDGWLNQQRGRVNLTTLPDAGSVALSVTPELGADGADATLYAEARLPAGSYVAIARATARSGAPIEQRSLLVVSAIDVTAIYGGERILLWAPAVNDDARVRLWMHGSNAPREASLRNGVALVAFPPEAKLLRDARWIAVVESGDARAVLRGMLPPRGQAQAPTARAALAVGPRAPGVGERAFACGRLLFDWTASRLWRPPSQATLALVDAMGQDVLARDVRVGPDGSFAVEFEVEESWVDRPLRAEIRVDGVAAAPVDPPSRIRPIASAPPYQLQVSLPTTLPRNEASTHARLHATLPSGEPVAETAYVLSYRPMLLPTRQDQLPWRDTGVERTGAFDFRGDSAEEMSTTSHHMSIEQSRLIEATLLYAGEDGRQTETSASMLLHDQPAYVWPAVAPPNGLGWRAAALLWADPAHGLSAAAPNVRLTDAAGDARPLAATPERGAWTAAWRPSPDDARIELRAKVRPGDEVLSRGCELNPVQTAFGRIDVQAALQLDRGAAPTARVMLRGAPNVPLLVFVERGDPLAVAAISPDDAADDARTVELRLPSHPGDGARVLVAANVAGALRILAAAPLASAAATNPTLTIRWDANDAALAPGQLLDARVRIAARDASPAGERRLIVRLGRLRETQLSTPLADFGAAPLALPGALAHVSAQANIDAPIVAAPIVISENTGCSAAWRRAFLGDETVWAASFAATGDTLPVHIPLPDEPARYRLVAALSDAHGLIATAESPVDTSEACALELGGPKVWRVGDVTTYAMTARNDQPRAATLRVRADGGRALEVGGVRATAGDAAVRRDSDWWIVDVPARSVRTVQFQCTAARLGAGEFAVDVEEHGAVRTLRRTYTAIPNRSFESDAQTMRIERSLYAYERTTEPREDVLTAGGLASQGPGTELRERIALGPDDAAPANALIVVEERGVLQSGGSLSWRQDMPANARTVVTDFVELLRIGNRHVVDEAGLRFALDDAAPGAFIHEYVVHATSPGACRIPAPRIRLNGRDVACELSGAGAATLRVAPAAKQRIDESADDISSALETGNSD